MSLFRRRRAPAYITVVSGLPRSGTSMMMRMLEAGGLLPVTDGERTADEDNPRGYYELERVKRLDQGDHAWLEAAGGQVVKIISALLVQLPRGHEYRVIFMRRTMSEVIASQRKMLARRNEQPDRLSDEQLSAMYEKHLAQTEKWLAERHGVSVLYVSFNEMLLDPAPHVERVHRFLDGRPDRARMREVVEPSLYRQRGSRK